MRIFISVLAILAISLAASATPVVLTCGVSAPTDEILTSQAVSNPSYMWAWRWTNNSGDSHLDLGQSFRVPGTNPMLIEAVTLKLGVINYYAGVPGQPYHLELWSVTDGGDWSGNTLLSTQSGTIPSSGLLGANSYWTFDCAPIKVEPAEYYAFMLSFDQGPNSTVMVGFARNSTDSSFSGRIMGREGTPPVWDSQSSYDLEFYIQATPVPEPTSLAFFGAGMVACAGWVRRTRRRAR